MKSALERLGHETRIGDGPSLFTTEAGAIAAHVILMIEQLARPPECLELLADVAARLTADDIAVFEAAWKLDASPESLRAVVQSMLNLQQPEPTS